MVLKISQHGALHEAEVSEENVETPFGIVNCTMNGITKGDRPVIVTYHDIGLNSTYPSMDQLSETIPVVLQHFNIKSIIGMAVGAGAYILAQFAVDFNSRMNPTKTTLLNMADSGGLPQVDQPAKLAEAFKYFIQGMGYMPAVSMTRLFRSSTVSGSSVSSLDAVQSHSSTVEKQPGQTHTSISMYNDSDTNTELSLLGSTHSNQASC